MFMNLIQVAPIHFVVFFLINKCVMRMVHNCTERPEGGEPIEGPDKVVRQEPFNLPSGFVWCTCNIDDQTEVYILNRSLYLVASVGTVSLSRNIFGRTHLDVKSLHSLISQMQDIYTLLFENYVEDDENMFRFDYSIPFLHWCVRSWEAGKMYAQGIEA